MKESILLKELCDQFIYYYDGIKQQKDISESPLFYYQKTTHVLKLTIELGLLKELCESFPKHIEWIVNDILENILPEGRQDQKLLIYLNKISEKIDLVAEQIFHQGSK